MNCKVSIIIPMYNVEKYLADCLQSVINQTLQDIEIICIDDASVDETFSIATSLAAKDNRIRIFLNEYNMGLAYTRNKGLHIAKGKYVYFLDSDDMITENALEELWNEAEKNDLDVVFFDGQVIYENESLRNKFAGYSMQHRYAYEAVMKGINAFEIMQKNGDWAVNVPREFWKKNFLLDNKIEFENGIIHEDELFSTLAVLQVNRCRVVKQRYFIRRLRENSTMTSEKSPSNMNGYFKCLCKIIEFLNFHTVEKQKNIVIDEYLGKMKKIVIDFQLNHCDWEINSQTPMEYAVKKMLELEMYQMFSRENFQKIRMAEKILIYGAGKEASRIFGELIKHKINVSGFVVTDGKNNVKQLWGLEVKECSEWTDIRNAVVIIAVKNREQMVKIKEMLGEYGVDKVVLPRG